MNKESKKYYTNLSSRYRKSKEIFFKERGEREVYLQARLPATAAVLKKILQMLPEPIESLLDLGAGPAASVEILPGLKRACLVEKDEEMLKLGQSRLKELKGIEIEWLNKDVALIDYKDREWDLGLFSYSYGEIPKEKRLALLDKLWPLCKYLILIEPGTPEGFSRLREARTHLIERGVPLLAPCPHQGTCPIAGKDWCHFSERLSRSSQHRQLKQATLNYEDEKFCYLIFGKGEPVKTRVLRHPLKLKGHLKLTLCTSHQTLESRIVSKKQGELYKAARDIKWGDAWTE